MTTFVNGNESFAQLCPLCKGKGEIGRNKAKHGAYPLGKTKGGRYYFECHVCDGKGVLHKVPESPGWMSYPSVLDEQQGKFWYNQQWTSSNGDCFGMSDNDQEVGLPDKPYVHHKWTIN